MRIRNLVPHVLAAALCAGCAAMPDYQLGYVAMERGDFATARYHFRALARMGLPEAQVGYGDILKNEGSPASLEEAESWYLRAYEQNYPAATGRLGRLYSEFVGAGRTEYADDAERYLILALDNGDFSGIRHLVELYFLMPERHSVYKRQLRRLTDRIARHDKAYADYSKVLYYNFAGETEQRAPEILKLCMPIVRRIPGCYLEVARAYHARSQQERLQAWIGEIHQAYRSGRLDESEVWYIANWMADAGQALARPALELLQLVEPNHPQATYARARLLYDYPALGGAEELLVTLARARARGSMQAELLTGRIYFDGKYVPADPALAERHFLKARTELPAADYFLGELYYRGYLGRSDPQRGLKYLLSAARRGHSKADYALAEMFWIGKGNRRNPVYALSFAGLAAQDIEADPKFQELYSNINAAVNPGQRRAAEQLREQEIREREQTGVAAETPTLKVKQAGN
ncbi:MAG TPA: hypothetical protein VFX02_04655 [Gammaproteobacteria bacterium]|nr:hypothetical protein [Gammaproteobacteria bacterium]